MTGLFQVSIATSPFRADEPQYHPTRGLALPVPTADTVPLPRAARAALGLFFRAGYSYQGAARRERLLAVLDGITGRWGWGTLRYLAEGGAQPWWMRRERLSQENTTDWAGLPGVG